jgi:group I intron endonuclease
MEMIGIYCIRNLINDKRYIGKSINIKRRLISHKCSLTMLTPDKKAVNRYLYTSVQKYGIENFLFETLETFDYVDEDLLKERELYYMDKFNTCDGDSGYNLRRDSSTKMICHPDTRALLSVNNMGCKNPNFGNRWSPEQRVAMSERKKKEKEDGLYDWQQSPEWREKVSKFATEMWKDEDKKNAMAKKVALATSRLRFYEYNKKTLELNKVWESMSEILEAHPDYFKIAIYSVCNGHKKSYRGSVWKSELKEPVLQS